MWSEQAVRVVACRRRARSRGRSAWVLGALVVLAVAPATAGVEGPNPFGYGSGQPWIFQSGYGSVADEPGFDHYTRTIPIGTTTLHLYATAGPTPSSGGGEGEDVCSPPVAGIAGDEICGMDVQINLTGAGYLAAFRPAGPPGGTGIAFSPETFSTTTKSLSFNSVRSTDPIPAGAHKLGELDVTVQGNGVVVTVSGNAMVLGGRTVANVVPNVIAVPEPGEIPLLLSALLGLAGLSALRRRHTD
jgi:hypothetical protein